MSKNNLFMSNEIVSAASQRVIAGRIFWPVSESR